MAPARPPSIPQSVIVRRDQQARPHSRVARGIGVRTHGADLEADHGPIEEPQGDRHGDGGQQDPQVSVATDEDRQGGIPDVRRPAERGAGLAERSEGEVGNHEQGDVVEHDRGDHLVGPGAGLEEARDEAPRRRRRWRPPRGATGIATTAGWVATAPPTAAAAMAPMRNWPWTADVEQAGLEADPDGQPAQDERRRQ